MPINKFTILLTTMALSSICIMANTLARNKVDILLITWAISILAYTKSSTLAAILPSSMDLSHSGCMATPLPITKVTSLLLSMAETTQF